MAGEVAAGRIAPVVGLLGSRPTTASPVSSISGVPVARGRGNASSFSWVVRLEGLRSLRMSGGAESDGGQYTIIARVDE
jgi:hypothetical protein